MARRPHIEATLTMAGCGPCAQDRDGQANQLGRGEEIHFHDLPQHRLGRIGEMAEAADAGIVDQHVQAAEALDRRFQSAGRGRAFRGNVSRHRQHLGPLGAEAVGDGPQPVGRTGGQDKPRPCRAAPSARAWPMPQNYQLSGFAVRVNPLPCETSDSCHATPLSASPQITRTFTFPEVYLTEIVARSARSLPPSGRAVRWRRPSIQENRRPTG